MPPPSKPRRPKPPRGAAATKAKAAGDGDGEAAAAGGSEVGGQGGEGQGAAGKKKRRKKRRRRRRAPASSDPLDALKSELAARVGVGCGWRGKCYVSYVRVCMGSRGVRGGRGGDGSQSRRGVGMLLPQRPGSSCVDTRVGTEHPAMADAQCALAVLHQSLVSWQPLHHLPRTLALLVLSPLLQRLLAAGRLH